MASRRSWTKEACAGCGAVYRYDRVHAEKASWVLKLFQTSRVPACPECGCVPLANIAARRRVGHMLVTLMWCAGVWACVHLGFDTSATAVTYSAAGLIFGIAASAVWLAHLAFALADPNRRRDRNVRRSALLESGGLLERVSGPDDEKARGTNRSTSRWAYPLLTVGAVGVLLFFAPVVLKAASGWPENPGTKPDVAGPGDTVRVWFPDRVDAVEGIWNGTAEAEVLVEGESAPRPAWAVPSQQSWGNTIGGKNLKNTRTQLWADVRLPFDQTLAGKRVEVRTDMTYKYPCKVGATFQNYEGDASTARTFSLAERGAADKYLTSFVLTLVGEVLLFGCGVGLWVAAHRMKVVADRE